MTNRIALFTGAIMALLLGCETSPAQFREQNGAYRQERAQLRASFADAPRDRPGLGTRWGETRQSPVEMARFERADFEHPFAIANIYYNDPEGIRAMAGAVVWERVAPFCRVRRRA